MGIDQATPISLTDNINSVNDRFNAPDSSSQVDMKGRADYQVLQQQLTLNKLNVQRFQMGKYPSLAAAYTYQQSAFGETIDYSKWYSNSFLALQLSVPIFSGFGNDAKIQKAKIEVIKTENSLNKVENLISLDLEQSRYKYLRAVEYVIQQKENLELANRIYKTTMIKYNEGVGSNLEMITANQDMNNTQTNYLIAVYDLLVAKLDFLVATGQSIKF
jgi:outer membrane protein TolC